MCSIPQSSGTEGNLPTWIYISATAPKEYCDRQPFWTNGFFSTKWTTVPPPTPSFAADHWILSHPKNYVLTFWTELLAVQWRAMGGLVSSLIGVTSPINHQGGNSCKVSGTVTCEERATTVTYYWWSVVGITHLVERQTRDGKIVSSNPGRSGGIIFFSTVNFCSFYVSVTDR